MTHEFTPENQARIQDLIATSLKIAKRTIKDQKLLVASTLWHVLEDEVMEVHDERVAGIKRYFFELETGKSR